MAIVINYIFDFNEFKFTKRHAAGGYHIGLDRAALEQWWSTCRLQAKSGKGLFLYDQELRMCFVLINGF